MPVYLALAFKSEGAVVNPEKLYREQGRMASVTVWDATMSALMVVNNPTLRTIFQPAGLTIRR